MIDNFVKESETQAKLKKKDEIKSFFDLHSNVLAELADKVFDSPNFFDEKWLNASTKSVTWQAEINEKIRNTARDIQTIQSVSSNHAPILINKYLETQNIDETIDYYKRLKELEVISNIDSVDDDDKVIGFKTLKIYSTQKQMAQLINQLEMMGIEYEELEDGMPVEQVELKVPDFDSFIVFDIETSGTYGVANGDLPAEITEIGAVKVINGTIVDRVDWLCNPGRKIVPRIAQLTNITDEMVATEPPVSEIIKKFVDYVGDLPVVGHNIRSSDLHYISRAAKKAGIAFSNPFFDTYLYAKQFKETKGWSNVKLEYLSDYYGSEQSSAHRAYCDAEANAQIGGE